MGLDMYLEKRNYVKNWSHMKPDELHKVTIEKGGKKVTEIKEKRISYIVEELAYWRKANMIHNWFVQNVQNGEDNCKSYYCDYDNLKELRDICRAVLEKMEVVTTKKEFDDYTGGECTKKEIDFRQILNIEDIEKELPTASGFFFGGTEYDEWYIRDLEETDEVLTKLLAEEGAKSGDYYYHSSW